MINSRSWVQYSPTYRSREMEILRDWMIRGISGSVIGLPGAGKSNFLGFLCHRPDVLQMLLVDHPVQITLIPIDLNNLPDGTIATFYRVILRAFYETRSHLSQLLQPAVTSSYLENYNVRDPFVVQSALRELLGQFQAHNIRVGFVFDRFDDFCETARPQTMAALRGLRDSFKTSLFYIAGMRWEAAYISTSFVSGELYEIFDTHICWIGSMSESDAQELVRQETCMASALPTESEVQVLRELSGAFPSVLKVLIDWWLTAPNKPELGLWPESLLANSGIVHRLQGIIDGLSQEEFLLISELEKPSYRRETANSLQRSSRYQEQILIRLSEKGLCYLSETGWKVTGTLLASYLAMTRGRGKGRIWLDEEQGEIYQGSCLVSELTHLEREVLRFLLKNPRIRHTKTELIVNAWPEDLSREGITDESLYQVIAGLRKKIEPAPARPCYIVNWRGKPEGGYQLFPEGRPT